MYSTFEPPGIWLNRAEVDPVHVQLTQDELHLCLREIGDILDQEAHPNPSLLLAKMAFLKMLARASAAYMRGKPRLLHESFRPEVWMALDEVEGKISGKAKLSVDALAQRCGITPEHLARLFKAATGQSLMAYYQRRRIQYGTRMLLRPDVTVTEVAHHLGYCDSSHFNRLFTRYHGVSPSVYRDMLHSRAKVS
jgi:AraC family transcriptional regulator